MASLPRVSCHSGAQLPRSLGPTLALPRQSLLHKIRLALNRSPGPAPEPPPVLLEPLALPLADKLDLFVGALARLACSTFIAESAAQARDYVAAQVGGRTAVASNAELLQALGIAALPGVRSQIYESAELRSASASAEFGITSADFGLADTGTLVMLSSPAEARLISLLPPKHLAVLSRSRLLSGLDELLTVLPKPAGQTSSMVLITGPSRTGDIEQILIRGVHGPGELHVVVI